MLYVFIFLSSYYKTSIVPDEDAVEGTVVGAGDEVALEVNFHMVESHDGVGGMGAFVANKDEALYQRKQALEVYAEHIARSDFFTVLVGDITTEDSIGFETPISRQLICLDYI